MIRWLKFGIGSFAAVAGVFVVTNVVRNGEVRRLSAQVDQLERDKALLRDFVQRLSASRRVAQIDVIDQYANQFGEPVSSILWQEIGVDGTLGSPQYVEAVGDLVYFEAAVIKFDEELVAKGDEHRGSSLAVFRRIFGDRQASSSVAMLDQGGLHRPPDSYEREALERRLWDLFWRMMDDPALAEQYGVRVAQCEAPAVVLRAGQIWEITLDADGGLNLRIIGRRPTTTGEAGIKGAAPPGEAGYERAMPSRAGSRDQLSGGA